ncbi:MAG: hemolysin family protein [Thermomicrobiales bacterium]
MQLGFELFAIAVLLGINAFLAASEISLVSVNKMRMRSLAEEGNPSAVRVLSLIETPARFLAVIQIGITMAGFFAAAFGAVTLSDKFESIVESIPISIVEKNAGTISLIVITIVLSFLSIVLGELAPKTLAVHRADSVALLVSRPINFLATIMRPLVLLLTGVTNVLLRLFGSHERANMPGVSEAEILALLEAAEDEGVVERGEAELVEEAFEFGDIQVRSVMIPRVDVTGIEGGTSVGDAMKVFLKTGFSRLPVYRETPDDVLGILHIKDVMRLVWDNPKASSLRTAELVRPAYVVPETRPIDDLLADLRSQRTHLAIVADEYGGMAGIVTLEDLIEELVGEIADEFDPGYEPVLRLEESVWQVDGRLSLLDLLDVMDVDKSVLSEVEAESVGGLISDILARIPEVGDQVEIGPLQLKVESMDGYRVALARVERLREDRREALSEAPSESGGE